jgi:restriction endonuclease
LTPPSDDNHGVPSSLIQELAALESSEEAQARGYLFEAFLARLFRQAHYDVFQDPAAARPRQTDLIVRDDQATYLVEARWRTAPAGSRDIDELHSRLKRTPSGVEGIFVSMSGFVDEALAQIESWRSERLVIPLGGDLLRRVVSDPDQLPPELQATRESLMVQGSVAGGRELPTAAAEELPAGSISIRDDQGGGLDHLAAAATYSGLTFCRELPDIDWVAAPGHGVSFDLRLAARTPAQLIGALGELSKIGWAGPEGQWTITQSERVWHGFGPRSLAFALEGQAARLEQAGGHIHHTEEVFYVDRCEDGFYSLSARPLVGDTRVWPVRMSFQLPGIPLETARLHRLTASLAPGSRPFFRPRAGDSIKRIWFSGAVGLEVVAPVAEASPEDGSEPWVVGLVTRNPFYGEPDKLIESGIDPSELDGRLQDHELLICDLLSWHPLGQERAYRLRSLEVAATSDVAVLRPLAEWGQPSGSVVVPQADRPPGPRKS